jgi:hypothetical protein
MTAVDLRSSEVAVPFRVEIGRLRDVLDDLRMCIREWQVLGHRVVWNHASPDPAWSEVRWIAYRAEEAACEIGPCSFYNEAIRTIEAALDSQEAEHGD